MNNPVKINVHQLLGAAEHAALLALRNQGLRRMADDPLVAGLFGEVRNFAHISLQMIMVEQLQQSADMSSFHLDISEALSHTKRRAAEEVLKIKLTRQTSEAIAIAEQLAHEVKKAVFQAAHRGGDAVFLSPQLAHAMTTN